MGKSVGNMNGLAKKIKSFAAAFLAALICLISIPELSRSEFTVYAADGDYVFHSAEFTGNRLKAVKRLTSALENRDESVSFSDLSLSENDFEDVFTYVMHNEPQLWYVNIGGYRQSFVNGTKKINFILPDYIFTESGQAAAQKKIDAYMDKLLSGVDSGWSDAEKVLYVHDYIAEHTIYGYKDPSDGRSVYETFIKGKAVCVGYALSFMYVMEELGIECKNVISSTHIWNMVKLDGSWYHVDVTWDDSVPDYRGHVDHTMLLLSDKGIRNTNPKHETWVLGEKAASDKYSDYFWKDTVSPVVYYGGSWYYSANDGIRSYSFESGKTVIKVKSSNRWSAGEDRVWAVSLSSRVLDGENIYYNTPDGIKKYDISAKKVYSVKNYRMKDGMQIFSLFADNGVLKYSAADDYMDGADHYGTVMNLSGGSAKKAGAPECPESIKGTLKDGVITLSWSECEGADSYTVYRYSKKAKKIYKIFVTEKTKISFKSDGNDVDYIYAVKAMTANGSDHIYSDYSKWTSAKQ